MNHDFQNLRLDAVTRRFAGAGGKAFNALSGLTMTIKRGEFIALLGPSGCGKSTALNCIAGLLPLSDGSIWLDDTRIDTLPPEQRGFGMVFQNYALFPHMTVEKNVGFGLKMRGVPAAEIGPRVAKAMKMVQLTGQEGKLPGQLSGGQQQRVAIARAIVIEPPLILMDEPLVQSRRQAADRDARRNPPHPSRARSRDDLRDARSGRGAVARRSHRRDEGRRRAPDRAAARRLFPAGEPRRCEVHGLSQRAGARRRARGGRTRHRGRPGHPAYRNAQAAARRHACVRGDPARRSGHRG